MSLPKCVETIYRLPHAGKEIVHPLEKSGIGVHHRYGHGVRNSAEPAPSNRGSCHPHRCGHVHRAWRQVAVRPGPPKATREALEWYKLLSGASCICERLCLVL